MKHVILIFLFIFTVLSGTCQVMDNNGLHIDTLWGNGYFVDSSLMKKYYTRTDNINFLKSSIYIFFNNGNVMFCNLGIKDTDSSNFVNIIKRIPLKNFYGVSWGKYSIENNIIKVHFYYEFFAGGLRLKYFDTYFEGIIKDKNTIINWKMVAPYPKVNKRLNENYEKLKIAKTLMFIPQKGVKSIQADKAWINK